MARRPPTDIKVGIAQQPPVKPPSNDENNNNNIQNKDKLPVPHRHNTKILCNSPPAVLKDKKATVSFTKGKILGEVHSE